MHRHILARALRLGSALSLSVGIAAVAHAQDQRNEQFYYPGSFNWQFLKTYPEGGRLFNAFDYGHAVLYEKLLTRPADLRRELEDKQFTYLTTDLLVRPPRFAVAEEVIEPSYSRLAWQAKQMFDWAHVLHRQIYDVYADDRIPMAEKDSLIERLTDYYLTNHRAAFTTAPKSMTLMDEQYYSQVFRKGYPKFNGLIWAYHWLQVGLYEPLIAGRTRDEKKAGVQATLARFWSMLEDPPQSFPKVMPMTSAVAPQFSRAHPRAAVIFDNLHMMHDIISDILAADTVPPDRKREVIYEALAEFRDSTENVMSLDEWRNMAEMMGGLQAMGGPATDILGPPPSRAAPADAMPGMDMHGMQHGGRAQPRAAPDSTGRAPEASDTAQGMPGMRNMRGEEHHPPGHAAGEVRPGSDSMTRAGMEEMHHTHMMSDSGSTTGRDRALRELHERMMSDPVIRRRVASDTTLQRLVREAGMAEEWKRAGDSTTAKPARTKPARPASRRPSTPPAAKPAQPDSTPPEPMPPGHSMPPGQTMPKP